MPVFSAALFWLQPQLGNVLSGGQLLLLQSDGGAKGHSLQGRAMSQEVNDHEPDPGIDSELS